MKFELTDNELQMYNSKVQVWVDGLHDYIYNNFTSDELKIAYEHCIESANNKILKIQFGYRYLDDLPAFAEKYGKSNCVMKLMKAYKEMHPFPKLVEL